MADLANTWVTADLHLSHSGIIKERHGIKMRPFATVEEHDETIIAKWNARVHPRDKVYVAGDVVWKNSAFHLLARLNGKKHLIKGNHDIFPIERYLEYFYEVNAYRVFQEGNRILLSHMPVHPRELERFKFNVHGHLHHEVVMEGPDGVDNPYTPKPDPRYMCVSLEQTDYAPVAWEDVTARHPLVNNYSTQTLLW